MNINIKCLRAMVIDDDELMCKLIALQLRALGCQTVDCHGSGSLAVDILKRNPGDVHLVICDLQMPGMDGVEVLRSLALMRYRGAVLLVSGEHARTLAAAERLAQAHGLRVLGAIKKPIEPVRLAWLLNNLTVDLPSDLSPPARPRRRVSPADLSGGLDKGQLLNHYQPKVCMRTGRVVGMEALVRWLHPEWGMVYPDEFIPVAEEEGLIDRLTRAVIAGPNGVLRQLRHWLSSGLDLRLAVNVSMDNLLDLGFPDFIMQAGQAVEVSLSHLVLEVTESRLHLDTNSIADVLTRLRLKHLSLSIDDFGTGYSSLAQLQDLPFDELKVDKRFVHRAHEDHVRNSILNAGLSMARDLAMSTTGEGVETLADWYHLQSKGCDLAQGYWIARPMPPEHVPAWISGWHKRIAGQPELLAHGSRDARMSHVA